MGPLMVDIAGTSLTAQDKAVLQHPLVGGVILFTRNFLSRAALIELIQAIQALREPRLLIAVDCEGGRVQRFRDGFINIPAMGKIGDYYTHDPQAAIQLAQTCGYVMAAELVAIGVDVNFGPVLDLNLVRSALIGDRSFHADPHVAVILATALIAGMNMAGMQAVGKHFPGHGAVSEDSHTALPIDDRPYADIIALDCAPYQKLIAKNLLAGVMAAHIVYSAVDPLPAGFTPFWLKLILRQELGFKGFIFSDDLSMAGAEGMGDYTDRVRAALNAGCDMALICNQRQAVLTLLDKLPLSSVRDLSLENIYSQKMLSNTTFTQDAWLKHVQRIQEFSASTVTHIT
jgi:beta-N-acetylhexosaminidase